MSGNPEASRIVATYRKVLPERTRYRIAQRITPEVRSRVKKRISEVLVVPRQIDRIRVQRAVRRHPDLFTGPDRIAATVDHQPRAAFVHRDLTPLLARRENLGAVVHALEQAGVDYFCVRGTFDRASTVGVAERDRSRALRALFRLCRQTPGYVTPIPEGETREPRFSDPGFEPFVWRRAATAPVVRFTWYHADPEGRLVLGVAYGCDVEFWTEETPGLLTGPRRNRVSDVISADGDPVEASDTLFTRLAPADRDPLPPVRTRVEFTASRPDDIDFPIDVVYTWVDGSDPEWLRRRAQAAGRAYHAEAANAARYLSRDELKYSLRSLRMNAPWVRNVYLVTDDQVPEWLDTSVPGLKVVSHKEIFSDPSVLPTFNSHAIESQLHHIEGLAEHFLYFNDDMFLGREVTPQDFFHANGLTKFFPSPANVPQGEPSEDDVPVSVAGKNNRELIESRFGTVITQKMKHVAYPLRRSVLYEIEEEFADRHRTTMRNRFRSLDDLSIASSLHHYYAFHTRRAVPGNLRYTYVDLALPDTPERLVRLLAGRDRHAFCINDTVSTELDLEGQLALVGPFLEAYFPLPSRFEKHGRECD
ncbi:stealth family protein [Peterkaempfera bronchialis]|uniref:Sugar phosphotransferase n=1 Tax=Peterkaempfera bronchialis TaxID=2126346 RepID=A0A345SWL5_9ACTN|nr:stealth family protein [Peterkaempfera bronchialis]AXI78120.1 sugar phosphotransferase [Peterkaempfera bronchialis]